MAKVGSDYIYRRGTAPETRAALSIKNKVYSFIPGDATFKQIGVLSSFAISESRTVDPIRGIGYGDQIAELIPGVTEPIGISVERTMLYLANLMQIFGYKSGVDGLVRSLKHHRWPFDIKQELVFSEIASGDATGSTQPSSDGKNKALVTIFEACWMNSYGATYSADAAAVAETSDITVSDVLDVTGTYGELIDTGNSFGSQRYKAK